MTRFKIAFVAAAFAVIAVGCEAGHQPPTATRVERGEKKAARNQARPDDAAAAAVAGPAVVQRSEKGDAYVIIGAKDDPKAVNPEVRQGKGKGPARFVHPAGPEEALPVEEPTFTVAGDFLPTREKAKESAIREAVEKLHQYLLDQSPPVTKYPTTEMVRRMLVRHPGASEADAEYGKVTTEQVSISESAKPETMYKVEIAVRVKPEQVRELRARERSSEALWVLAGLGGLAGVLAVFFRIDAWTKGYLTSWLVLGTVGAAALLTGLWWFAR
jgi:hypothetical protein